MDPQSGMRQADRSAGGALSRIRDPRRLSEEIRRTSEWTVEYSMAVQEKRCSCGILSQRGMMSQCGGTPAAARARW